MLAHFLIKLIFEGYSNQQGLGSSGFVSAPVSVQNFVGSQSVLVQSVPVLVSVFMCSAPVHAVPTQRERFKKLYTLIISTTTKVQD